MTDELKPCPFCGDESSVQTSGIKPNSYQYMVMCRSCNACKGWKNTYDEALTAWNTRHESDELPEWLKKSIMT